MDIHSPKSLARVIDHTLLKPEAHQESLKKLCQEALEWNFLTVCVNPRWLKLVAQELRGSETSPITVVGFPLGATFSGTKVDETSRALDSGAREIDMVLDLGAAKSGDWNFVEDDITKVVEKAKTAKAPVKVILETCLLSDAEIIEACHRSVKAGASFVKTSTGFSTSGATTAHVALMRKTVGQDIGVKASGGVKNLAMLKEMIQAGANRIGTSQGVAILREWQ